MRNIELYEALKEPVGEEAARLIAEIVPASEHLATKLDVTAVQLDIARLEKQMAELEVRVKDEIHTASIHNFRWMLGFFIPVWTGTWGTVVAVLLKG